ncbi:ATP-grasp domain-containing protein [Catellatospora aurea]|uniref:ATP-grasp domain-containing protein n=1 Tax=Catellatospora aurea TaxID=1337874 RepID=A0ABW2GV26_9ACTN
MERVLILPPRVTETGLAFADAARRRGLDDAPVLVSDVVRFEVEFRLFVAAGRVLAASRYAVDGELDLAASVADPRCAEAAAFASTLFAAGMPELPSAVVVDVGLLAGAGAGGPEWAVIEANAAWASGHYAADPDGALDVVLAASRPVAGIAPEDRRFLRHLPAVSR